MNHLTVEISDARIQRLLSENPAEFPKRSPYRIAAIAQTREELANFENSLHFQPTSVIELVELFLLRRKLIVLNERNKTQAHIRRAA